MGKWDGYIKELEGTQQCLLCSHTMKKRVDRSTSLIIYHFKSQHPHVYSTVTGKRANEERNAVKSVDSGAAKAKHPKFTLEDVLSGRVVDNSRISEMDGALAKMLAADALPTSVLCQPGFQNFCKVALPRYDIRARAKHIDSFVAEVAKAYSDRMKAELFVVDHIVLTVHGHLLDDNVHQLVLIFALYMSNFEPKQRFLGAIKTHLESKFDVNEKLESILHSYRIEQKIAAIVQNENTANVKRTPASDAFFPCFSYKLHLATKEGTTSIPNYTTSIERVKTLIRKLKKAKNLDNEAEFGEIVELLGYAPSYLKKGADVNWNILYKLFDTILWLKQPLSLFLFLHPDLASWQLDENDYDVMETFVKVLEPVHEILKHMKDRPMTASCIIPLAKILIKKLRGAQEFAEYRHPIANKLEEALAGYECSDILVVSTAVDPRFKLHFLEYSAKQKLLNAAFKLGPDTSDSPKDDSQPPEEPAKKDDPFAEFLSSSDNIMGKVDQNLRIQVEIDKWITVPPTTNENPYEYWKMIINRMAYPTIFRLAEKYLIAPLGLSELTPSRNQHIVPKEWQEYDSELLENLLFLHKNIALMGF